MSEGNLVAVLAESQSRSILVELTEHALHRIGTRAVRITARSPALVDSMPVRSTGASYTYDNQPEIMTALGGFSVDIIRSCGAQAAAVMISLNRQERGQGATTAIAEVEQNHGITVSSIVTLFNILEFLENDGGFLHEIAAIREYHHEFGG